MASAPLTPKTPEVGPGLSRSRSRQASGAHVSKISRRRNVKRQPALPNRSALRECVISGHRYHLSRDIVNTSKRGGSDGVGAVDRGGRVRGQPAEERGGAPRPA